MWQEHRANAVGTGERITKWRSRTLAASLGKGLLVLETLASIESRGSVVELMKHTGLDRAAVYRMLRSLMYAGYVERRGRGEYGVSVRAHLLGVYLTRLIT